MKNTETLKTKGVHTISICDCSSEEARSLQFQIETVRINREKLMKENCLTESLAESLWRDYNFLIQKLHAKFLKRQFIINNITTTVGRAVFARRLAAINTYTGNITHTALGSSNAGPLVGNTQLGTETYRKALSSGAYLSNVSYIETFFTATEVTGTFEEYGNFIDGGAGANSGQLFNRWITTITKSNVETLNIQSTVTWADA